MDYENNDIQDVNFTTVEEKTIRGKALYYSTSQVATILGITDSKTRYYTKEFDSLFDEGDIVVSNTQRRYTQKSIDKLKYFIELKSEGMTIKQIREYCQEIEWDEDKGVVVQRDTPLQVQMIATALREEQQKQLEAFELRLSESLKEQFLNMQLQYENMNNEMIKEMALTVDEVVADKLEEFKKDFIKEQNEEREATAKTVEMISSLKDVLEKRQEENEKKSWFNKLFSK